MYKIKARCRLFLYELDIYCSYWYVSHNLFSEMKGSSSHFVKDIPFQKWMFSKIVNEFWKITVDLVIFACLNFREFMILGLFGSFALTNFPFS